jgi:hypothetical protein
LSGDYSVKEEALLAGLETLRMFPQLDLFASKENRWYTHFCSLKRNATTLNYKRNPMHLLWEKDKVLLPPIPLIVRILQKFEREGSVGVMIAPDWKSQIWTPILKLLSVKKIVLGNVEDILEKGSLMKKKDL